MAYLGPRDPQTAIEAQKLRSDDLENRVINTAIAESVQEFPPAISAGPFYAAFVRGPILPPFGTKERDRQLRLYHRNEYNLLWQGAIAGIIKRIASTPYTIDGPAAKVDYFQTVLGTAQFGQGWEIFVSRFLEDYFTQDYGGMVEIIAMGDPNGPLTSPVIKLASLDAGRVYVTGNPYYPFLYYSLYTNALHRMHASRIWRFVDQPSPDERYLGIGLCALSRCIAAVNREIYMNRFVETRLDDKPKPGVGVTSGITPKQRDNLWAAYSKDQGGDEKPAWGKVFWIDSVDLDKPADVKFIPFAQTPELFDFEKYKSLDVNEIALGLGIDRQELWELSGRALGSGSQSAVLAEKARGKTIGYIYQCLERFVNVRVLPEDCEFKFKIKDETAEQVRASIDGSLATIVSTLTGGGKQGGEAVISAQQARAYLANQSEAFRDVLTNDAGNVEAADVPLGVVDLQNPDIVSVQDDNPLTAQQAQQQATAVNTPPQTQADENGQTTQPVEAQPGATQRPSQAQSSTQPSAPSKPKAQPESAPKPSGQQPVQQGQQIPVPVQQKVQPTFPKQQAKGPKPKSPLSISNKQPQVPTTRPQTARPPTPAHPQRNRHSNHQLFRRKELSNGNGHAPVLEQTSGCVMLSLERDPAVTEFQQALKGLYPDVQWTDPNEFHVTLVYMNDVENAQAFVSALPKQINELHLSLGPAATPFDDNGDGVPLVLAVKPTPELIALQSGLAATALSLGNPLSEYSIPSAWHPHVTLGYIPEGVDVPDEIPVNIFTQGSQLQFSVDNSAEPGDYDIIYTSTKDRQVGQHQWVSKEQAQYTDKSPMLPQACINCRHFIKGGHCEIVDGLISQDGFCNYYEGLHIGDDAVPYEDTTAKRITNAKSLASTLGDFKRSFVGLFGRGVRESLPESEFENELIDLLVQQGARAYLDGLRAGGVWQFSEDGSDEVAIQDFVTSQLDYVAGLADQIYNEDLDESAARDRAAMWVGKSVQPLFLRGLAKANSGQKLRWVIGPTERHCPDCSRLHNQVHTVQDWLDSEYWIQADSLDCQGFNCLCRFVKTNEPEFGEF